MPFFVTPRSYLLLVCGFVAAAIPLIGKHISTSYRAVSRAILSKLADFCARSVPGAAPNLEECTNLLEYGTMYYEDLDAPDQRAALMRFYGSTGGAYWNAELVSDAEASSSANWLQSWKHQAMACQIKLSMTARCRPILSAIWQTCLLCQ